MSALPRGAIGDPIPASAGVGLKPEHYQLIIEARPTIGWFEVHAENYMEAGGPPHHFLSAIRSMYPLSVHGVGMSIGADGPLDLLHLARLKSVCDLYQPDLVSEHLAWSTHDGAYLNDLLPLPYTRQTLQRVCEHVDQIQSTLKRRILLENPSTYIVFQSSEMSEVAFIKSIAEHTGCGLLLDVNNVFVSATNHGFDPIDYVDKFPLALVAEIHLGGHSEDSDDSGARLLIDAHGCEVADPVWDLFSHVIACAGRRPTLIEWDNDVPEWERLHREAIRAEAMMHRAEGFRGFAT